MPCSRVPFVFIGNHRLLDFLNTEVAVEGEPAICSPASPTSSPGWQRAGALDQATARAALRRWDGTRAGSAVVAEARRAPRRAPAGGGCRGGRTADAARGTRAGERLLARGAAVDRVVADGPRDSSPAVASGCGSRLICWSQSPKPRPISSAMPTSAGCGDARIPACVLYFLDGTKNGTRRWCDMRTCGNRANAAAYYRRHHGSA